MPISATALAVAGPTVATRTPNNARESRESAASLSRRPRTPFGLVKVIQSYSLILENGGIKLFGVGYRAYANGWRLDRLGALSLERFGKPAGLAARPCDQYPFAK